MVSERSWGYVDSDVPWAGNERTCAGDRVSDSIGARIRSGVAWKAGSQLTLQLSRMLVALILARLLTPDDWGVAAMVLVVSGFVVVFTDSALVSALVQRRDLRAEDCSTVFWASAGIGALLMLVGLGLAHPLANFYGEPEVAPLFAALSVGFFVSALRTTPSALLLRSMDFRRLELVQIAATLVGAAVGVAIALGGGGPWAIVGQQLAEVAVGTGILWLVTTWRPSTTFSLESVRRLAGFTGNLFGENLLFQAGRNLSGLLIGRFLGASSVGVYALATNIVLVPASRIAGPLQQVFFPAFSQLRDDVERTADIWIRTTRLVAAVSFPSLVGLMIVAPDFVEVVLGSRWDGATTVIQILAIVGLIQSVQTLSGDILLARGRADWLFRFTVVWFVLTIGAFALGVQWGIVGVAACYAAVTVLVEPLRTVLACRALGIGALRIVAALREVADAAIIMGLAVLATRVGLAVIGVTPAVRLVSCVVVGGLVYLGACLWRAPSVTGEIRRLVSRRRAAPTPSSRPASAGGANAVPTAVGGRIGPT
jgi:O-antigen/teichoic acid export membrane protein